MPLRNSELLHCSFCSKSHVEAKKMIAGPNVYICDECALGFMSLPREATLANVQSESCSFCGKRAREVETIFQREAARICKGCLDICQEIIEYDSQVAGA